MLTNLGPKEEVEENEARRDSVKHKKGEKRKLLDARQNENVPYPCHCTQF